MKAVWNHPFHASKRLKAGPFFRNGGPWAFAQALLAAGILACLASPLRAAEARFTAALADGTRVQGGEVVGWHDSSAQPRLDATLLFDPANPVRWLRDNTQTVEREPGPAVEFYLGDRLPGRVLRFQPASQSGFSALPSYLLVEPEVSLHLPDQPQRREARVDIRWVRRVIWRPRGGGEFQPSTVFCRDGRRIKFRSLRWTESAVRLLLEEGTSDVPFSAIAELHLAPLPERGVDPWQAYRDLLVTLSPDLAATLMRVETVQGLQITGSLSRFQARAAGSHDPEAWYHLLQPAWSLEPLWLRHRTIALRRFHAPWEVPLSEIEPRSVVQQSLLGGGWRMQINRSVHGGPLVSGGESHGWGFGVHAANRLEFDLPSCARTFRARLGLDAAAGRGGCAEGLVFFSGDTTPASDKTSPLFRSPVLIGAATVVDCGPLALSPPADGSGRLVLAAETAHDNRPPGADPLDIRDSLDWLEPQLDLDRLALQEEVLRGAPRQMPAWEGWNADLPGNGVRLRNYWDAGDLQTPRYRLLVQPQERFFSLSRTVKLPEEPRWLLVAVDRPAEETSPARIQVQIEGEWAAEFEVPAVLPVGESGATARPDPLLVSLAPFRGREVRIGITQLPSGERAWVDWRAISILDRSPAVLEIFDDDEQFSAGLVTGTGQAAAVVDDKHTGDRSLMVQGGSCGGASIRGLPAAVREHPRLGEFRYLRFAWKKVGGRRIRLELGHDGRFGPLDAEETDARRSFRYAAGRRDPSGGQELLHPKLPSRWTVVTRDLFADFGEFNVTGLSFESPDGERAMFDQVYLGRTIEDLEEAAR